MRIVAIHERTIPLAMAARNASIGFAGMTASALAVHTDARRNGKPLIGLAFDSIGRYGHGGLLRERFIPRLLAAAPDAYDDGNGGIDPRRAWTVAMMDEKPGGHGERSGAVGLIDAALWDLAAKSSDQPLWKRLAPDREDAAIEVYASGGHYRASHDVEALRDEIRRAMAAGHRRFKIKIGGAALADDRRRTEAVLAALEPGMTLAVDGNGTFDRATALHYAEALSGYPLAWLEEPVPPLDFELHREIAEQSAVPIATGENLFSADDARNLLRYGGLRRDRDFLQFDISLSYGIVEYERILECLEAFGWRRERCAPHAGHLFAMQAVAGLELGLAETTTDAQGLFGAVTSGVAVLDGRARLPDAAGTGFEASPVYRQIFDGLVN